MLLPNQEQVIQTLKECQSWEDKYRQIIQWGKALPAMSDDLKIEQHLVNGCESKVWLFMACSDDDQTWHIQADSDARIVRGLIAILLTLFARKSSGHIAMQNVQDYFAQLGLSVNLSESRNLGIEAIARTIQTRAKKLT